MALFSAFCGGHNPERSGTIDAEATVNLFHQTVQADGAAKQGYLIGTPGLRPLGTAATTIGRGIFTQDGQAWTVIGTQLYPCTVAPFVLGASLGTIPDDGSPVSFACNGDGGRQLVIVGGGVLKVLNLTTNLLSPAVVLPLTRAPVMVGFLDAYFLLSEKDSLITWFSTIENGLIWDALDFFTRSTASDHSVGLVCAFSRAWVFGSESYEAYEDTGDADNPFQPIKGSLSAVGCVGPWTITVGANTIRFVGANSRSGPAAYRLDNYAATRISTPAMDKMLAAATTLATAESLYYEAEGHVFYAITVPAYGVAGITVVSDELERQWHVRSAWNATLGREERWRVRGHAFVGQTHVVGSWDSGSIWALDLDTYDDDGAILRARRRAPYLGKENDYAFLDAFELGVENGVGLTSGQGSDPQVELLVSKDSAHTWFSAGNASLGPMGEYDDRTYWTRLGQARVDRLVLEVVITDPVKRIIGPGAWIRATPGRAA